MRHLGETVDADIDGIVARRGREFHDEIHRHRLPGASRDWEGVQLAVGSMARGLVLRARFTCPYILFNEPPHARPIVIPGYQLQRFVPTQMACELGIMTLSQYLQLD